MKRKLCFVVEILASGETVDQNKAEQSGPSYVQDREGAVDAGMGTRAQRHDLQADVRERRTFDQLPQLSRHDVGAADHPSECCFANDRVKLHGFGATKDALSSHAKSDQGVVVQSPQPAEAADHRACVLRRLKQAWVRFGWNDEICEVPASSAA